MQRSIGVAVRVLVACEYSGRVRDAFAARGHDAWSCDLLETEAPGKHYKGDVRDVLYEQWDLLIAHPVCTRLTNAGSRWLRVPPKGRTLKELWDELDDAVAFYKIFQKSSIKRKAIENPIMHYHARSRLGDAKRQIVQPWWFGEEAFKATGFELTNLPELVPTNKLIPPKRGTDEHKKWSKVHRESPGPNRWKNRSRTYQGVAEAMAAQWD